MLYVTDLPPPSIAPHIRLELRMASLSHLQCKKKGADLTAAPVLAL